MVRIALLAIAGWLVWSKLGRAAGLSDIAKQVQVALTGVNLKKTSGNFFSTTLYPKIQINNPTASSGKIDSITGTLYLNDSAIGSYSKTNITINPGQTVFEVPVELNNLNLLAYIVGAITKGTQSGGLSYKITGIIITGAISATFTEKCTVITPKIPSTL